MSCPFARGSTDSQRQGPAPSRPLPLVHCAPTDSSGEPQKLEVVLEEVGEPLTTGSFTEAAAFGKIVILAVKGTVAKEALELTGDDRVAGKLVIDTTNPIADAPPTNGVLQFFTGPNESLMERLQQTVPRARLVKAWNSVGSALMVNPTFPGGRPTMFICGNNDEAKQTATEILDQFGWDTEDMGTAEAARAIEPLCQLWCLPGLRGNQWNHAFKLLRL